MAEGILRVEIPASKILIPALITTLDMLANNIEDHPEWTREDILALIRAASEAVREGK